jgi:hypothetical protein
MKMTTHPMNPIRSEKGVALIIVLLLLAVMSGLTTGLTLNSQTEIAMATNEKYHTGTRAAAEAGMNRAIEQIIADTTTDLMTTKQVPVITNGPIDFTDEYSYSFEILDDDDPALYNGTVLSADQLTAMGAGAVPPTPEDGDPDVDTNARMVLRTTATGPRGTVVTVGRILSRFTTLAAPIVTTINPALLVNGNLSVTGNMTVNGTQGNVHSNGDVLGGGSADVTGNITATGTVADGLDPDGLKAGGMPTMPVPEIKAADYKNLADYILPASGLTSGILVKNTATGTYVACTGTGALACPTGWTGSAGAWSASGTMPSTGTYYVEGSAEIHGTGKATGFTEVSIIAEGSIKISGNGRFKPDNASKIQFVTNGDFEMLGTADANDTTDTDGQILVREQMKTSGNAKFQGRIMVEDRDGATNVYDPLDSTTWNNRRGASTLTSNDAQGNFTLTYNGSLGGITVTSPGGPPTYQNIISGWMESQ